MALDFAPDTTIDACTLEGRSQAVDAIVYCSNWSPDLELANSSITAHGAINGVYLNGAAGAQVLGNHVQGEFAPFASAVQLWAGDDYAVVQGNTFGTASGSGPDTGVAITDSYAATVSGNVFHIGNANGQARDCGILVAEQGHNAVLGPGNQLIGTVATGDTYGIYLSGTSLGPDNVVVTHNEIDGRSLVNRGLMAVNLGANLAVDGNDFGGCITHALQLGAEGTMRVTNNLVHDNAGTGILLPASAGSDQPQLLFNTIVCNALGISGDGRIWYNIVWSNTSSGSFNTSHGEIHCNDVQGRASLGLPADNADIDPRFVAAACGGSGDYHLRSDSPLIDFACSPGVSPPARPANDVDGDPRPQGAGYDVGMDE
ncbi:MAG: right-handed parallel beta-helix repeat-containing protein [Planctomycetota bacterium]